MSDWIERVQNHRVWTLMKDLGPLIDNAINLEDVDAVTLAGLERLRAVLTYCGKRLGGGTHYWFFQPVLRQWPDRLNLRSPQFRPLLLIKAQITSQLRIQQRTMPY